MRISLKNILLSTTIIFALSACNKAPASTDAASGVSTTTGVDALYFGGDILTMAGDTAQYAEAIAVKDGKIIFVGTKAEADKLKGANTKAVDLAGRTLMPSFIDSHAHYINMLSAANQAKLYAPPAGIGKDVDSIIAELKKFVAAKDIKPGEIIMGYGYDDTVMPDGRLLTRDDLDTAFPDNPVRVDHVSMHGGVLNTAALKFYGVDPMMKTPAGGIIVRKPGTEEIGGLIMETAFLPVFEKSEAMTPEQEITNTRAAQLVYAEAGITTAQEGATHLGQWQTLKRAADAGANSIDIVAYPFITDVDKILAECPRESWLSYNKRLKIGGVKISIDGSPQGKTAAFTTPYLVPGPGGEKGWKGELFAPQEIINAGLKKVYDLDVPVLFHVNGDAAIDSLITAHESAAAGSLDKKRNITSIHSQFIRKDQIAAFLKYGIRPSYFTLHTYYFAEAHLKYRGQAQTDFISPMRFSIDAGMRPTNHTDAVVVPLDQMFMLWTAVNRKSRGGADIGLDQRITPYEGLKTMTLWAAEQYDEQSSKGSLEIGKLADLVILDQNPLKVKPMAIKDIKVLETIKEGKSIYTAK
jgi:predicted amidohydrolase YtcJ